MAHTDNYLKQAAQAKAYFLTYDQEALIRKLNLAHDEDYLYPVFFSQTYRLSRKTGDLARQGKHGWEDANTHGEVMALLDLICDSREDRFVSGKWKDMAQFGHAFHQNLLEERDPLAEACQKKPQVFRRWCEALGGNVMTDAFGVVALVALTPLIAVQLMGVAYRMKMSRVEKRAAPAFDGRDEIVELEEEWA